MLFILHSPPQPPNSGGRNSKYRVVSPQDWLRCTHKSEITDEFKFEHSALPHPSPPLVLGVAALKELGEGASPCSSPLYKGGLRGVMQGFQRESNLCVHGSQDWGVRGGSVKPFDNKRQNLRRLAQPLFFESTV